MRRPLMIGALAAAVIALVGSMALALGTTGDRSSGPTMMRGDGQSWGPNLMGDQSWEQNRMGGSNSGPNLMGDQSWEQNRMGGSNLGPNLMGGSMMGSADAMGMVWLPGDGTAVSSIPAARARARPAPKPQGFTRAR